MPPSNDHWCARLNFRSVNASPGPRCQAMTALYSWATLLLLCSRRLFYERFVGRLVHQAVELGGIANLDLEEPGLALRILIDERRLGGGLRVDLDHLAGNGGKHIAGGLDAFHHSHRIALLGLATGLRHLHEDDVAQLRLGVLGDADGTNPVLDADPFVVLGVALDCHVRSSLLGWL